MISNKFFNLFFNKIYQKIKYNKNYLYNPSFDNLTLHKKNFYLKKIVKRKKNEIINSFKVSLQKMSFDNSINLIDLNNPLVKTSKEIITKKNIKYVETSIFKFIQNFKPKNFGDVYFLKKKNKLSSLSKYTLFYPWFHKYPQRFLVPGMFGPKDPNVAYLRFLRLKNLIELIKKFGYLPTKNDVVMGYILLNNKDFRFVITAGAHRCSVLYALNKSINMTVVNDTLRVKNNFHVIDLKNIKDWPGVKSGYTKSIDAKEMFLSFFKKNKINY